MVPKLPSSINLADRVVIVATNKTEALPSSLFYNLYGPPIIAQYVEAATDLGAEVVVCSLEETIRRLVDFGGTNRPFFVVNICAAFQALECEGIIQAVAALSMIPCFPSKGDVAIIAEEKIISKQLAQNAGFLVVNSYRQFGSVPNEQVLVRKPINGGDSKGIRLVTDMATAEPLLAHEFAEPFVAGFDLELFCVLDPISHMHVVLNAKLRNSQVQGAEFTLHGTQSKSSSDTYQPHQKAQQIWDDVMIAEDIRRAVCQLGKLFHNTFIFRIDARVPVVSDLGAPLKLSDIVFLEINVMPTIPGDTGWLSPLLFGWAGVDPESFSRGRRLTDGQKALRLLLLVWNRLHDQSKSDEGNIPV